MNSTISIPYPTRQDADIVRKVITVDLELKPRDVQRIWEVILDSSTAREEAAEARLQITIHADSMRTLRLNVNATLEDVALVTRSIQAFDLQRMAQTANPGLELGSVGRAG